MCKDPLKLSPPTNHHAGSYRPDALPVAQPTVLRELKGNQEVRSDGNISRQHECITFSVAVRCCEEYTEMPMIMTVVRTE